MRRTKKRLGRPPGSGAKPAEEKYRGWQLRFHPAELAEFLAAVPAGERAAFARSAILAAVRERAEGAAPAPAPEDPAP